MKANEREPMDFNTLKILGRIAIVLHVFVWTFMIATVNIKIAKRNNKTIPTKEKIKIISGSFVLGLIITFIFAIIFYIISFIFWKLYDYVII